MSKVTTTTMNMDISRHYAAISVIIHTPMYQNGQSGIRKRKHSTNCTHNGAHIASMAHLLRELCARMACVCVYVSIEWVSEIESECAMRRVSRFISHWHIYTIAEILNFLILRTGYIQFAIIILDGIFFSSFTAFLSKYVSLRSFFFLLLLSFSLSPHTACEYCCYFCCCIL